MVNHHGLIEEKRMIPHRLVYGYYPEVVTHTGEERERLRLLSDSFLYKDILMYQGLKKPEKLVHLLKMLAANISCEINYNQLSKQLQLNNETVEKYIQLLEQCYVIFRLPAFATNLTKELKKGRKVYFTDNGIINSLTGNFSLIENRNDKGALWENFVISEMYKQNEYKKRFGKFFFWRSHDQQEVDLIIQKNNLLETFEIKWSDKKMPRLNKTFSSNYPKHSFQFINYENAENFLL
jgi:predicted AAA+ superfamily ATPase